MVVLLRYSRAEKRAEPQELCESRGGRPRFHVVNSPNSPNGLSERQCCGRKATLKLNS